MVTRIDDPLGEELVRLARRSIETALRGGDPEELLNGLRRSGLRRGVFVTLYQHPSMELRGCIGFPRAIDELEVLTVKAALAAAFEDPRFEPVREEEMDGIVLEVSVLTEPELIRVQDRRLLPREVEVGRHGLIIELGERAGLLLPQVPVEYGWDAEEFLVNLCFKAGLGPTEWLNPRSRVYRFEAELFAEEYPRGPVRRVELKACRA
ncbi:MAG: TIGR00296 family protein [Nitrososphaerota archaeon]|nr:TIGR00296 family protein [Candidatus Calditenuis fumarioli]